MAISFVVAFDPKSSVQSLFFKKEYAGSVFYLKSDWSAHHPPSPTYSGSTYQFSVGL